MVLIVTGVSTLIHLYSFGYMQSDEGYHRFFSYLNFFVFSMLLLVLAGNFVLLIVGWAFVGFASYALISFWYRRTTATRAGMKAFVINVVGDIGLTLAAFLIFRELGTFDYAEVFAKAPQVFHTNQWTVTAICLLLLVGAFAKSAQLPFHTWLPDAMEGPTPVSSLIHAATMVTAGVYLIARTHVLFVLAPTAADIAAFVGLATLLVAGTIALVMTDLKRAIAYSTMSQIGYMIMGVSIGAYSAGMFHLMTHAFFKALLFMARRLDHLGDGEQAEHRRNERLRQGDAVHLDHAALRRPRARRLPRHLGLLLQGRDPRLRPRPRRHVPDSSQILGYFGALLTAIYTFRLIFRVLPGRPCKEAQELIDTGHVAHETPRNPATGEDEDTDVGFPGAEHHIAEQSPPMKIAMGVLAFLALFAGLIQVPGVDERRHQLPRPGLRRLAAGGDRALGRRRLVRPRDRRRDLASPGSASPTGSTSLRPETPAALIRRLGPLHTFLDNKWYFDELIDVLIVRPALAIGRFANRVFERFVVDGLVTGTEETVGGAGGVVRAVQNGFVRSYALLPGRRLRRPRPLLPAEQLMSNFLLWTPLAFGIVGLFLPKRVTGWWATLGARRHPRDRDRAWRSASTPAAPACSTRVDTTWISGLGVDYSLGIDGLNLFLILLTAVLWIGGIAFAAFREQERPQLFFFLMLVAETATLGSFLAQDLLLFVLFFDLMLVPFYFLFGSWGSDREGGPTAAAATLKMMIFTLIGSLLMLVGAIATAIISADGGHLTFSIAAIQQQGLDVDSQRWIFWFFAAAFLVKMPAFLLHGWMPDAYRAAPLPVLVVFSGVLAKVGAYGFLRVVLPLFPAATVEFQEVILVIALASILYGSVMAFTQTNVRLIAGYSSVAQLGFITAGIFALRADGADGAILQMVNHGLVVAPLFIIVAILVERTGTEDIRKMGGMALRAPVLAALFLIVALATLAMPGLGQLHRRVLHPQRPLPGEDRLRLRRNQRRRDVRLLRAAPLPADDAQP